MAFRETLVEDLVAHVGDRTCRQSGAEWCFVGHLQYGIHVLAIMIHEVVHKWFRYQNTFGQRSEMI